MSLYEQLGAQVGISTAVDRFYERVLGDPSLAGYFDGADVDEIRKHQVALLSTVSGGPVQYSGRALDLVHRRLSITGQHFDQVVQHLADTLDELGAAPDVRNQVTGALVAQREQVVSAPAAG